MAGRIVLSQSVLTQLAVYWAHLFFLPTSIIKKINKFTANFIWGLLDLRSFGKALLCKSLWRGIYGEGPWCNTIKKKYMVRKDISYWFRLGRTGSNYGSAISLSFQKVEKFFLRNLTWSFQSGSRILIGIDSFLGGQEEIVLPDSLLNFFYRKRIFTWDKLIDEWQGPFPLWKEADSMEMSDHLARQWRNLRTLLRNCDIYQSLDADVLIWKDLKGTSLIRVKDIYQNMIGLKKCSPKPDFPSSLLEIGMSFQGDFFLLAEHGRI